MKVLSVASECAPLVKTGGLADVAGALPGALDAEGVEMRTLLPGYPVAMAALKSAKTVMEDPDLFGGPARVLAGKAAGLSLYVLDAPHLYDRPGAIYHGADGQDWPDNALRFAALGWTAARIGSAGAGKWRPSVLHVHDWQAALAPLYLRQMPGGDKVGALLTIHNIAFQGLAPAGDLHALRLPESGFTASGYEYWGQISTLKAGIVWADKVSTVSPTYARELMTPEFGMGLDGLLRSRGADFSGILNGVDTDVWNPATDTAIKHPYKTPRGKARAKAALRREFGLPDAPGPLTVLVSRLTQQKGLDMLLEALPVLLHRGGQLALLGSGDPALESAYRELAAREPGVAVHIGYDEAMAHRLIAGGNAILVPSRFEPCGLTQMYGLRYGTLPVVALTGGLADTVIPANPAALGAEAATGLQVYPVTTDALAQALSRLADLFALPEVWARMQKNAMAQDVSWRRSAVDYAALYQEIAHRA
ncbi:MAG: glycogen synthase GlgA [Pseudomonadota bacterium]